MPSTYLKPDIQVANCRHSLQQFSGVYDEGLVESLYLRRAVQPRWKRNVLFIIIPDSLEGKEGNRPLQKGDLVLLKMADNFCGELLKWILMLSDLPTRSLDRPYVPLKTAFNILFAE